MALKERLDKILVIKGLLENTSKAKAFIMSGKIIVNGKKIEKSGSKFPLSVDIEVLSKGHKWVSRGGVKLSYAIKKFNFIIENRICADLGSSTGGFTDVLIKNKAQEIYCVDVGKGQLDWKLVTNKKVIVLDKTNVRNFDLEKVDDKISLITCDLSFISIKKALIKIINSKISDLNLIVLIKPQFELSREKIGKNGIVRNNEFRQEAVDNITSWFSSKNWKIKGLIESPITGAKGNKEYFLYAKK